MKLPCRKCGNVITKISIVDEKRFQVICSCGNKHGIPRFSPESARGVWLGHQRGDIEKYGENKVTQIGVKNAN